MQLLDEMDSPDLPDSTKIALGVGLSFGCLFLVVLTCWTVIQVRDRYWTPRRRIQSPGLELMSLPSGNSYAANEDQSTSHHHGAQPSDVASVAPPTLPVNAAPNRQAAQASASHTAVAAAFRRLVSPPHAWETPRGHPDGTYDQLPAPYLYPDGPYSAVTMNHRRAGPPALPSRHRIHRAPQSPFSATYRLDPEAPYHPLSAPSRSVARRPVFSALQVRRQAPRPVSSASQRNHRTRPGPVSPPRRRNARALSRHRAHRLSPLSEVEERGPSARNSLAPTLQSETGPSGSVALQAGSGARLSAVLSDVAEGVSGPADERPEASDADEAN